MASAGQGNLASLYRDQGKYAEAEPLYKRALEIYEKALGLEHPDVAQALENYAGQIQKQLKRTAGLVGYRLRAKVFAKEFFHLSVWESETAVQTFVHQQPHLRIMGKLVGSLGKTEFRYWTVHGSELPLMFERELQRLNLAILEPQHYQPRR